jgi:hypothetical protein
MSGKKGKPYDFENDYKALPVKKRLRLIMIAKTLLKVQKEGADMAAALHCEKQRCMSL